jgi:putative tryptophan/tyrosine transport system substrate-binding protein
MIGKIFWLALCALLFALSYSASAQQPTKVPRIGYLSSADPASESARSEPFRLALRELGYIDGQNISTEYRYSEGKNDRLPELAAELVRLKVDIIVTGGVPLVRAAKNATKTIPIVMMGQGSDPVEAGLIESLARPGGNVTGLTNLGRELGGKRLELLKEAVPKVARVAVLHEPAAGSVREVKEILPVAARALGLTIRFWEVRAADDFDRVFAALNKQRPDGLYVLPGGGPLMFANGKRIAGFASKSRLPSMYTSREFVDTGGLMYYGADLADSYRRVAYYVDKILKGAKPAELPVEQPTKFEFVINLKAAKQIGLTIPPNVLARADKVIR